ncbi:unnamed protein product [Didymodactylos carnosus]|uniref:Uncharacterized protein n=1 Tax=Didymodactylos carnosus TaxID=1234261 RepID=A0A8S2EJ79_9BILA|nr:unnamed protein product [Didymodactylos carnosus]CAF3973990.1 unnamed protein product [Didymodactylos carnosus]
MVIRCVFYMTIFLENFVSTKIYIKSSSCWPSLGDPCQGPTTCCSSYKSPNNVIILLDKVLCFSGRCCLPLDAKGCYLDQDCCPHMNKRIIRCAKYATTNTPIEFGICQEEPYFETFESYCTILGEPCASKKCCTQNRNIYGLLYPIKVQCRNYGGADTCCIKTFTVGCVTDAQCCGKSTVCKRYATTYDTTTEFGKCVSTINFIRKNEKETVEKHRQRGTPYNSEEQREREDEDPNDEKKTRKNSLTLIKI